MVTITLDKAIPEISRPADTKYVKHIRIRSEKLSKFWGRDMHRGANILLPEGFDSHPTARYPLVIETWLKLSRRVLIALKRLKLKARIVVCGRLRCCASASLTNAMRVSRKIIATGC